MKHIQSLIAKEFDNLVKIKQDFEMEHNCEVKLGLRIDDSYSLSDVITDSTFVSKDDDMSVELTEKFYELPIIGMEYILVLSTEDQQKYIDLLGIDSD